MQCRQGCGACCIAPSIKQPFYGMPAGKAAGEPCVHLDEALRCRLFDDPRRPECCGRFQAEPDICADQRKTALINLMCLENMTSETTTAAVSK
ncbi:MAG: YkgJ family cysteine cluster protein [Pseudomonadota bacterium]